MGHSEDGSIPATVSLFPLPGRKASAARRSAAGGEADCPESVGSKFAEASEATIWQENSCRPLAAARAERRRRKRPSRLSSAPRTGLIPIARRR
jgi:hypothetical protein